MDHTFINNLIVKALSQKGLPVIERIESLRIEQQSYLTYLSVINEYLCISDMISYLEICGFTLTEDSVTDFIELGISHYVIVPETSEGVFRPLFGVEDETKRYLWQRLSKEAKRQRHIFADQFYRKMFAAVYNIIHQEELSKSDLTNFLIRPGGFIDFGAHYPQVPEFHNWSLHRAYYWQEHLFALGKLEDAGDITNSICFALARKGHKDTAKRMLARNAAIMSGLSKSVALVNLATLLREDLEHKRSVHFYRRAIIPLIQHKAIAQLAAVLSEISNIYRDRGRLIRAIIFQHSSSFIRSLLKDLKGKAICNNQLSILYRSFRLRRLALKYSQSAESFWRATHDEVNLAKTLLTQGNIYNHMRQPSKALNCFDESLSINRRIGSLGETASSLSGKARAFMQLKDFANARPYLEDAIALRKKTGDRRIGVEYQNMGGLNEKQGHISEALSWYHQALPYLEKYQPNYAPYCKLKIRALTKRLFK